MYIKVKTAGEIILLSVLFCSDIPKFFKKKTIT